MRRGWLNGGTSFRWSFGPHSAWSSIESKTIQPVPVHAPQFSVTYCASNDDYWFLYRNDYSVTSFAWNSFFQLAVQNFQRNWILNLARLYSHHNYRFVHGWHYMLLEIRIISEKCTTLPWNCKSLHNVTHLFLVTFINFSQFQNTKVLIFKNVYSWRLNCLLRFDSGY